MSARREDTLQVFIDESLEHLAAIENDLLAIEEAGAAIDEERVNKVFRAAHSIKGGAGFMNLGNIKELAHRMENVLGMIRSRRIVPNPENINILLLAADALRGLLEDTGNSDETDISEYIDGLDAIAAGIAYQQPDAAGEPIRELAIEKSTDELTLEDSTVEPPSGEPAHEPGIGPIETSVPKISSTLNVDPARMARARDAGMFIYLILVDPAAQKNSQTLFEDLRLNGEILASAAEADYFPEAQLLEGDSPQVLFACVLDPADLLNLLEIDARQLFALDEEMTVRPVAQTAPEDSTQATRLTPPAETSAPAGIAPTAPQTPPVEESKPEESTQAVSAVESVSPPVESPLEAASAERASPSADAAFFGEKPDRDSPPAPPGPKTNGEPARASAATSLRVHVDLLDNLMNLAGELVLGRNQLLQAIASGDPHSLGRVGQRIDHITSELQETIVLTRLQPVGNIFGKFPRVVRDMSRQLGKLVDLAIEGEEVELDKTLIEAIDDPLTHLVRNAIDHGIEKPDERLQAGKSSVGRILLKAYHREGRVNIQVADDGRGLDPDRLAAAAVAKGFVSEDRQVARIEKIRVEDIEEVGDKRVIQHRGSSLVVFSIDQVARVKPLVPQKGLLVIVFSAAHREIGLLATGPVEAVDVSVEIDESTLKQPGIAGSAIIKGRTSLLVDIYQAVRIANMVAFLLVGIAPLAALGIISLLEASNVLEEQAFDQLVAVRQIKKNSSKTTSAGLSWRWAYSAAAKISRNCTTI